MSSTNELLHSTERIVVGKTGFIRKAGYCFAAALHAAGHAPIVPAPRTQNASLQRVMHWLELDTPGFILTGSLAR